MIHFKIIYMINVYETPQRPSVRVSHKIMRDSKQKGIGRDSAVMTHCSLTPVAMRNRTHCNDIKKCTEIERH